MHNEDFEPVTDETIHRELRTALAIDCSPDFGARVRSRMHSPPPRSRAKTLGLFVCASLMLAALGYAAGSWRHRQPTVPPTRIAATDATGAVAPTIWWPPQGVIPRQRQGQSPDVVSGADIGFRVDAIDRGRALGKMMVRVNGQWLEAQFATNMGTVPIQAK